ncbi:DUF4270 family protein [Sphingobacterium sp. SYP-B4668]|uniref:DUF4270 family protein n=1 Tax=Sphingobacterium sp. SYP-B4668 TaxID=2996035 RepID=UPI000AADC8D7|nr:DUF4270 family protein [Sphingobacterium sp. SYP-B4668]
MSISLDGNDDNLNLSVQEDFEIQVSTFQIDNLPSSSTGTLLVGKSTSAKTGSVSSSSYFRLGLGDVSSTMPTDAIFDSLTLVIKPNRARYFYGDTTANQKISVHQVTENILLKDITSGMDSHLTPVFVTGPTLFGKQSFAYNSTALGEVTFAPKVRSMDTLSIKLDQTLGSTLFDMFKNNDVKLASNQNFQEFFKGMVIVPATSNSALIGFSDTLAVKVNYSYIGADGFKAKAAKTFTIDSRAYQHNNITFDRTGTAYETLTYTNKELKSEDTNNDVFIQGGTGVVANIKIPSLREFMADETISINKAQLTIETPTLSSGPYPTPPTVMLMLANINGIPVNALNIPFTTTIQHAQYIKGNDTGTNGKYVFDMIEVLKNINSVNYYDTSLFLTVSSPNLFSTTNSMEIAKENNKPKVKLNIVYTKF